MLTELFFPFVDGVRVECIWWVGPNLHLVARTTCRAACCPLCGCRSRRVHSRYQRTIADLPVIGLPLTLHLQVRRFVCRVRWCRRRIFSERLTTLVAPSARRTTRLQGQLRRTGFALGGAPGAQHATAAGMSVSRRTLLRLLRAVPPAEAGPVRVLGVDDWAQRRGRTYGTILVNLETHRVIDLLPDRTAASFAAWLRRHPEVEIISRDRGGAYAEGARMGAPQATQVADRFHLLRNVTEALERFLIREYPCLRQAARALVLPLPAADEQAGDPDVFPSRPTPSHKAQEQLARRERKLVRYEEVVVLRGHGYSLRRIAAQTCLDRRTVKRYLQGAGFPENQLRAQRTTQVSRHVPYLRDRWAAGCRNAKDLWKELRRQGFTGGYTTVTDLLRTWRERPVRRGAMRGSRGGASRTTTAAPTFSARQTLWLLLRPRASLTDEEQAYLLHLYHACPTVALAQALAQEFAAVLGAHDVEGLYAWLRATGTCPIRELSTLAQGMWLDRQAIEAAVTSDWSQGQTEGQVNRLKALKRSMYGRAKLDLLRQRLLHTA